jgi:isopentenyl-diphosphate delta-isomerase
MHRCATDHRRQVAEAFANWGIPTAESLLMVRQGAPDVPVIASGGVRDGIQMAKALALGAAACGVAGTFLRAASESAGAVTDLITVLVEQLRVAMFAVGAPDIPALQRATIVPVTP